MGLICGFSGVRIAADVGKLQLFLEGEEGDGYLVREDVCVDSFK